MWFRVNISEKFYIETKVKGSSLPILNREKISFKHLWKSPSSGKPHFCISYLQLGLQQDFN